MKLKKIMALMLTGVLLCNTIPANAYTNSCSGYWNDDTEVSYSYCSDGTLVIEGTDGTECIIGADDTIINAGDIKYLYIKNVGEIERRDGNDYLFSGSLADSIEYCYLDVGNMIKVFNNNEYLKELVFGDNVHTLGTNVANISNGLRVTMPSTITSIADDWLYGVSTYTSYNVTIVCEYGSEAYNWALSKKESGCDNVSIELMDVVAQTSVVVDNSQKFQIVVPESISFEKGNDGWSGDSFVGIIGDSNGDITVKTSDSFNIIGKDIASTETVTVTTDNSDTTTENGFLSTCITQQSLENATDDIDVNGMSEQGYLIEYGCKVDSPTLMNQKYTGTMKYIVSE